MKDVKTILFKGNSKELTYPGKTTNCTVKTLITCDEKKYYNNIVVEPLHNLASIIQGFDLCILAELYTLSLDMINITSQQVIEEREDDCEWDVVVPPNSLFMSMDRDRDRIWVGRRYRTLDTLLYQYYTRPGVNRPPVK